jgi:hypothetical protein
MTPGGAIHPRPQSCSALPVEQQKPIGPADKTLTHSPAALFAIIFLPLFFFLLLPALPKRQAERERNRRKMQMMPLWRTGNEPKTSSRQDKSRRAPYTSRGLF